MKTERETDLCQHVHRWRQGVGILLACIFTWVGMAIALTPGKIQFYDSLGRLSLCWLLTYIGVRVAFRISGTHSSSGLTRNDGLLVAYGWTGIMAFGLFMIWLHTGN